MLPSLLRMGASRLIRFLPSGSSTVRIGEPVGDIDVGLATYAGDKVEVELYDGESVLDPGAKTGEKVTLDRVLAPVTQRECGTIRCIGLNVSYHRLLVCYQPQKGRSLERWTERSSDIELMSSLRSPCLC